MYYVYTSVQSVIHTYDRLGRRFRFVYFMLVLLCFCVAAVSRRIKIYIMELLGRMHQAIHQAGSNINVRKNDGTDRQTTGRRLTLSVLGGLSRDL